MNLPEIKVVFKHYRIMVILPPYDEPDEEIPSHLAIEAYDGTRVARLNKNDEDYEKVLSVWKEQTKKSIRAEVSKKKEEVEELERSLSKYD